MGEMIQFPSNGSTGEGWLATPQGGRGPGVVVIQEWWGLVDHIKDVCERFASEGFVALAPDLFKGKKTTEPDDAAKMMMTLQIGAAAKDMSGAVDALLQRSSGKGVGVIGFCMGGGLALVLACERPDAVTAVVPFYGLIPWPDARPDFSKMTAAVHGHYAGQDEFASPAMVNELEDQLRRLGKDVELMVHPETDHAFFNDARPEVYNAEAAKAAWRSSVDFLRARLT